MASSTGVLGSAVPALTAHAISVSLPTWEDNVGYEEGDKRVVNAMVSGYPRFFIHLSIQKVSPVLTCGCHQSLIDLSTRPTNSLQEFASRNLAPQMSDVCCFQHDVSRKLVELLWSTDLPSQAPPFLSGSSNTSSARI